MSGIQFFGEFLIDRGIVNRGQLIEALELQEFRNLKFGEIAVQKKYLTENQVISINERQRGEDKRFGDLALEMGLLTPGQAKEIITLQKNSYLLLGAALLELGHIGADLLEQELAVFEDDQTRFVLERVAIPENIPGRELIWVAVDLTRKMFLRVVGILVKIGQGVRTESAPEPAFVYHLALSLDFDGQPKVRYVLSLSSDLAVQIASRVLREDATRETEEIVEDANREFVNIVCGNAAAKLSQMGQHFDISPPETVKEYPTTLSGCSVVLFPVHLADGQMDLRFFVQNP